MNRRKSVLCLRVELEEIHPTIWRRILVPATYTFWDLHVAIQDAMGWFDSHLHEFRVPAEPAGTLHLGIPLDEFDDLEREVLAGWEHAVADHLARTGQVLRYDYDFGDGWSHSVALEEIVPRETGGRYPRCIAGARACPPEDCGGPFGYFNLLHALAHASHPDREDLIEWLPRGWDPERFDPKRVRFDNPKKRWRMTFSEP